MYIPPFIRGVYLSVMEFNFNKGLDIVLERFLGLKKIWKACLDKKRVDKGRWRELDIRFN